MFTGAGGADVSLRDVTIAQWETGLASACDVTHRKRMEDLGDLKKSVIRVENETPNEKGRLSGLAKARRICVLRAPHEMGGGGQMKKARIERMCISLLISKNL